MKKSNYLLLALALLLFYGCDLGINPSNNCYKEYLVEVPIKIYPVMDTIGVGDTLWVEIAVDSILEDQNEGDFLPINNFDFYFEYFAGRLDTTEYVDIEVDYFDYVFEKGSITFSQSGGGFIRSDVIFEGMTGVRMFKMGMIVKETGTVGLSFAPPVAYLRGEMEINPSCIEKMDLHFIVNTGVSKIVAYLFL